MEIAYFRRLFRYDQWANHEVLTAMRAAQEQPEQSIRWLAHLAGAGRTWLARLRQETPQLAIWPELTFEESGSHLTALGEEWLLYIERLSPADLEENLRYRNSKGMEFTARVADILTHVPMHAMHHRGQIAANMRMHGAEPATTDFITAVLKNALGE